MSVVLNMVIDVTYCTNNHRKINCSRCLLTVGQTQKPDEYGLGGEDDDDGDEYIQPFTQHQEEDDKKKVVKQYCDCSTRVL